MAAPHPLRLGRPEDIPFLKRQTRFTFARCGIVDRLSPEDYRAHGGFAGLERAIALGPDAIIEEIVKSGLARPRRCRFSDRHQMADDGAGRGDAEIHRLQRRRRR